jgi:hypothetical protein
MTRHYPLFATLGRKRSAQSSEQAAGVAVSTKLELRIIMTRKL